MAKKIIYKKNELLGSSAYHSGAMRDIEGKDKNRVLNQAKEKKQLFGELQKYRDGGVTEKEMKSVLADLKYGHDDHFTSKEINDLSGELGLGKIEKKHLSKNALSHTSHMARAQHAANFGSRKSSRPNDLGRVLPGDDIVHHKVSNFFKKTLQEKRKNQYVSGDMMFEQEEEDVSFYDTQTGKRFSARVSQLKRPNLNVKSQASFRGRGLIGGRKDI